MNLFNQSSECPPPVKATVSVDINTEATVFVTVGIFASGTVCVPAMFKYHLSYVVTKIHPPKLDDFKTVIGTFYLSTQIL